MSRTLQILFRRDPSRDRQEDRIRLDGYQVLWPDGRPMAVGVDAFCTLGQRLLGLNRHLDGCRERLLEMVVYPQPSMEADITRRPGARVRRFYLHRQGQQGRLHFLDGTPTTAVVDLDRDEAAVLHWIGMTGLPDNGVQWLDLAVFPTDTVPPSLSALGSSSLAREGAIQPVFERLR
jgi:hypothetical protein